MASVYFRTVLFNRSSELEFIVMKQASYSHQITKFRKKMKKRFSAKTAQPIG